ncbi:helix-turn-helix domain-containing protein [Pseudomonas sp. IT-P4]|uniref:helix-turn-helix domain-containing protein n=1 Tax=Pseudomonas sp. IT-P4 TaxID=3026446 RepID=UPI0039DF5A29
MSNHSMHAVKFASMPIKASECPLVAIFAVNVRRRRLELGLSQEELAERAGVHRTYIGMIERSEKNVTIYNIERCANALEIAPYELLRAAE